MPDDPTSRMTDPSTKDPQDLRRRFEQLERVLGGLEPAEDEAQGAAPRVAGGEGAPGVLSVVAFPLDGGPGAGNAISYRADEPFPSASTIKVYVLQALLERVAAGDADLDDELPVSANDQVSGSGILKALTPGRRYTLRDIATLMIVVSDNTATNVLIEYVGLENLNASIRAHGWHGTRSAGKLQLAPVDGGPRRSPSTTTAADLADYFARLWRGELLPAPLTEEAKAIYRKQQFCEMGRSIGYDSYDASIGEAPWLIASKSGSIRGTRNDAGVFEPVTAAAHGAKPFVIAIMTKGCVDERFHSDNLGARVVGWAAAEVVRRLA
ncbi:MAG: serine hydrolase [Trueperaceae bacterium]|nr:serine hydrolase [Trueperaceae bacterium]MCC6310329.1 serine hydrolase [Trueperaceae bacterium]MCO5173675.1 class A beta-lactamase-related serine hydrolase [Trueperaceae bacterium]MCW5819161.1 serine hydrolase [Trueperaceae bacterium]